MVVKRTFVSCKFWATPSISDKNQDTPLYLYKQRHLSCVIGSRLTFWLFWNHWGYFCYSSVGVYCKCAPSRPIIFGQDRTGIRGQLFNSGYITSRNFWVGFKGRVILEGNFLFGSILKRTEEYEPKRLSLKFLIATSIKIGFGNQVQKFYLSKLFLDY